MVKDGLHFSMHVTLRYRPYGPNVDIFDIFIGDSEEDAFNNLKKYISMCQEKFGHYVSPFPSNVTRAVKPVLGVEMEDNTEGDSEGDSEGFREAQGSSVGHRQSLGGKGAHFIGTTWVAHMVTKDKRRIQKSDLEEYLAKGYVKAGPRTKI